MLQLCPQCQIPVAEAGCPRCGRQSGQEKKSPQSDQVPATSQPPIQFDVMVSSEAGATQKQVDWKGELKKKLEQRTEKNREDTIPVKEGLSSPESEEEPAETPPTLFKYKLDRALRNSSTASSIDSRPKFKKEEPVFREPLIRRKPVRPVQQPPGQKTLHLKPSLSESRKKVEKPLEEVLEEEDQRISKEVLFSRFLAGIIDLVLPLLTGFAFTIVASFMLGFDLFSQSSIKWICLLSLSFFFFNSLFFLLTSGQTPGMSVTDLKLVGENEESEVEATSVLLRVALFLPSALTIVGLGWAIFDPLCRCLHDLVSRTRIEPTT